MSSDKNRYSDNIGGRLRFYRKSMKMNGSSFSEIIGISQGSLSDIETSKTSPSAKTLEGLVRNTDINIEWLLTGEGSVNKNLKDEKQVELSKGVKKRKFEIFDKAEEWLNEEVEKNPKREIWFEVEFEKAFQEFKEWKEESEERKAYSTNRKVA